MNNAAQTAALLTEIQDDTYTDAQLDKVEALHATFTYTSTMLAALSDVLSTLDPAASRLVLEAAERMAQHEATVA